MTKKDYELFAMVINAKKNTMSGKELDTIINICVSVFTRDNINFKPQKFWHACLTGSGIRSTITA